MRPCSTTMAGNEAFDAAWQQGVIGWVPGFLRHSWGDDDPVSGGVRWRSPPKRWFDKKMAVVLRLLTDALAAALKAIRHVCGPYVFCSQLGKRWSRGELDARLWRSCRKAKLRKIGWHALRHTFCSHLAMRGAPARAIQELAGHASIATTQRYMHLSSNAKREAIDLLNGAMKWPLCGPKRDPKSQHQGKTG